MDLFLKLCTSQSQFSSFALKFGQYLDIQKSNTCLQIFSFPNILPMSNFFTCTWYSLNPILKEWSFCSFSLKLNIANCRCVHVTGAVPCQLSTIYWAPSTGKLGTDNVSSPSWLDSSVGRALHWYCRGNTKQRVLLKGSLELWY